MHDILQNLWLLIVWLSLLQIVCAMQANQVINFAIKYPSKMHMGMIDDSA